RRNKPQLASSRHNKPQSARVLSARKKPIRPHSVLCTQYSVLAPSKPKSCHLKTVHPSPTPQKPRARCQLPPTSATPTPRRFCHHEKKPSLRVLSARKVVSARRSSVGAKKTGLSALSTVYS